jgi:SAM-dependent methyltransferase
LTRRGIRVVGVDIAWAFLRAAGSGTWVRADGRRLPFSPERFDAAISLCQGAFGLLGGQDEGSVLDEMVRVVRPGGRVAFSAVSAYFVARHSSEGFDPDTGIHHEVTGVRSPDGLERPFNLWTTCFTPRELRLLAAKAGIEVEGLWSVSPGDYARRPPELDHPEWLVVGRVYH